MLDRTYAPPVRETTPTIPYDLREYARSETGPASWSAREDAHTPPPRHELASIASTDVPQVAVSRETVLERVTLRQALVIACIDGETTLESLIERLDMPCGEALTIVCELCASGILSLVAAPFARL
jgi:hypothetical protein